LKRLVKFEDWGLIDYKEAWDKQESIFNETVSLKLSQRDKSLEEIIDSQNFLIFCEHPHVFTLGKSGKMDNLLLDEEGLEGNEAGFYKINRGGDITYHGPGQIVGYPILDLEQFFTDIHKYLRFLEEAVIFTLEEYGIKAGRYPGLTGVWLDAETSSARKICAMGVRCSRWVTMHGFAFNVNPDLSYFSHIVPCGIDDKAVTSMKKELGYELNIEEVKARLQANIGKLFDMNIMPS